MRAGVYRGTVLFFTPLLNFGSFQPHGYCYQWNSGLVWLHVVSDALIALAYFTIPVILMWFIGKRRDLPFSWMFALFGVFIIACGVTHVLEVWNLWHAQYWLAGGAKAITAVVSVGTAVLLTRLAPLALAIPGAEEWAAANTVLREEVQERCVLETQLRHSETRYRETAELVDLTHDAIFVRNLANEITFWNQGATKLYGWSREEALGKTTHELLHTIFPKPVAEIDAEILETGSWEGELVHQRRDGHSLVVSSRWALRSREDEPIAILESNRDISQRKQEEDKFRSLLEAAPDAVVIINERGEIVLVNSQTEKMFGYQRSEILNQKLEILLPGEFREGHTGHRGEFYAHAKVRSMGVGLELHGLRKGNVQFPVEISLSPLETREGMLVSASVRDISERKRSEEILRHSDEKLRLLIQGVKDYAILMLDPTGHITTWNEGAERIKGYRAEEILGRHFSIFYLPEDVASGKPARELKIAEAKWRFEDEGWRVRKDGSRFWASVIITALRDKSGELRGFGKVTRDISNRRKAEEQVQLQRSELAQKNAQLTAANRDMESFSYSVSHDLRTPLRTIDGFSHALLEDFADKLNEEGKGHLSRIRAATQRMGALIDDLLNLSRLTRVPMRVQEVDISAMANSVVSELRSAQPERDMDVQVTEGMAATGDAGLLRVVFQNLLSNAWKFSSKKALAHIACGQIESEGRNAYFVRDDGAGFDPAYAGRLFGAFQRLHGMTEFEGTGVGLATVQRIVQRHNGRIWAESAVDKGATFYFTLNELAAEEVEA